MTRPSRAGVRTAPDDAPVPRPPDKPTGAVKLREAYRSGSGVALTAGEVRFLLRDVLPILDKRAPVIRDDEAVGVSGGRKRPAASPDEPTGPDVLAKLRAAERAGDGAPLTPDEVRAFLRDVLAL